MTTDAPRPLTVAVGDSDEHVAALAYAAGEALREGRGLRLVHVVHALHTAMGPGPDAILLSLEAAERAGAALLGYAAERAGELTSGRVPIETIGRSGATVEVLVELAETSERVILQHRQQSSALRVFTGSVTAGVAARSAVPVVSVPEYWTAPDAQAKAHITVAVSGSDTDSSLLDHAFATVVGRAGTLSVLHAWYLPSVYDDAVADHAAFHGWSAQARRAIDDRLVELREKYPTADVRVDVEHARPADAMVRASAHSDLLVLGRRHRAMNIPHLGSLTRAVIRASTCPVEVVPTPVHTSPTRVDDGSVWLPRQVVTT
jgi:nucleotide-binding universal stress UspA family protein